MSMLLLAGPAAQKVVEQVINVLCYSDSTAPFNSAGSLTIPAFYFRSTTIYTGLQKLTWRSC